MQRLDRFPVPVVAAAALCIAAAACSSSPPRAAPFEPAPPAPSTLGFFVTSEGPGDGANLGGLAGADQHCARLAARVGAGHRTWRAYLSTMATATAPAIDARSRIGTGPWRNAAGEIVARNIDELHGEAARIDLHHALTERAEVIDGADLSAGVANAHDMLTGTLADGTAPTGGGDTTCGNWTSNGEGSAWVGHHDRQGGGPRPTSWSSAHPSRGCSPELLASAGSRGLFYCFAADTPAAAPQPMWIEDDLPLALAEAQASRRPLVVEVFVPWSPTSRYLDGRVLVDPAIVALRDRFVWVRLDQDRVGNADAFARYPFTNEDGALAVLAPDGELVAAHHGIASAALLVQLVEDGARHAAGPATDARLAAADHEAAWRGPGEVAALRRALDGRAASWPSYARVAEMTVEAALRAGDLAACAEVAAAAVRALPDGADTAQIANLGLTCARTAPAGSAWRAAALASLTPPVEASASSPALLFDLRGELGYANLIELRVAAADEAGAARLADAWFAAARALVDGASEPLVRTAAAHLLTAAPLRARHCGAALEVLEALEHRFKHEYTYPHVAAHCHDARGDADAALQARLRACSKQGYGRSKLLGLYFLAGRLATTDAPGTAYLMLGTALAMARVEGALPIAPYEITVEMVQVALDDVERKLGW